MMCDMTQVRVGDVVRQVAGVDVAAHKKSQVVALLKGRAGTLVRLELHTYYLFSSIIHLFLLGGNSEFHTF